MQGKVARAASALCAALALVTSVDITPRARDLISEKGWTEIRITDSYRA